MTDQLKALSKEERSRMAIEIENGDLEPGWYEDFRRALLTIDELERDWDQNSVNCGNCSVQILTQGGSRNSNGLSKPDVGSEDTHLCGLCAGEQMYEYADRIEQLESHQKKLVEALKAASAYIEKRDSFYDEPFEDESPLETHHLLMRRAVDAALREIREGDLG